MENKKIIKEIINYLQLSTMEPKEKAMWMLIMPDMENDKLLKLRATLEKEVNAITDLYLKSVSISK